MKPIYILENQYSIPIHSFFQAVTLIKDRDRGLDEVEYRSRIGTILGISVDISDLRQLEYTYYYIVQNLVKNHKNSVDESNDELYARSYKQACDFIGQHEWAFAVGQVDDNGERKPRNKTKQELALEIYQDNIDEGKKAIIDLFIKDLDMSKAGATTYFYNLRKKVSS